MREKLFATAEGKIEDAVSNDTVTGDEGVRAVVTVRLKRVVGIAAETGVPNIQPGRFLIEEGVGHTKGEVLGLALNLCLERVGKTVADIAEAGDEIAKCRNLKPGIVVG